jgi:hypothetical protein
MPTPASVKHTVAYSAKDIKSLKSLEFSCERDEANLFSNVESMQLAALEDGTKATAVIYKEVDDFDMGFLTLVEYTSEADRQSKRAIHEAQGETFLINGEAYVNNNPIKVMVFREKPGE